MIISIFNLKRSGVIYIKDDKIIVKAHINKGLYDACKSILKQNKTTVQTIIESYIKDYVLNNMEIFQNTKKE